MKIILAFLGLIGILNTSELRIEDNRLLSAYEECIILQDNYCYLFTKLVDNYYTYDIDNIIYQLENESHKLVDIEEDHGADILNQIYKNMINMDIDTEEVLQRCTSIGIGYFINRSKVAYPMLPHMEDTELMLEVNKWAKVACLTGNTKFSILDLFILE